MLKAFPDQNKARSVEWRPAFVSFWRKREFSLQSCAKEAKPMKSLTRVNLCAAAPGQRITTTRAPSLARP
jgi:hypothetical protein